MFRFKHKLQSLMFSHFSVKNINIFEVLDLINSLTLINRLFKRKFKHISYEIHFFFQCQFI